LVDSHTKTAGRPLRIYEYVNADGVVFWSTTRLDGLQTHRMVLTDVRGTYFRKHLSEIHQLAMQGALPKDPG
jgi:hypothetical protein